MKKLWETRNLGDLCDIIGGGTPQKDNPSFYEGQIPWATVRDMRRDVLSETEHRITREAVSSSSTNIIPAGNVVIATRVGLGKVCILGQDTAINQDLRGVVPRKAAPLHVRYLYWWFKSIADVIVAKGTGATVQGVKLPLVKSLQIPLPPLPEQRRISRTLDEAFKGIAAATANAEQNLSNARALFESYLHSVVDKVWQTCELVSLAELASEITDGDHMPPPKSATGVPFITIGNVAKDTREIDFRNTFRVPREYFDALKPNKKPRRGDVLYTVTGSFGIPVVLRDDTEFCFQRHIGLIRPKPDVSSSWLGYLLLSSQLFKQATEGATGTAQRTVSLKLLRGFIVPKVSPKEQKHAVETLDILSDRIRRLAGMYHQKLAELEALKKSVLHHALTGQQ